jgi:flavodoxin
MAREILSGSPKGKKMVKDMVDEIVEELKGYEYEDTMKKYEDDDDDDDDEDFDDFLKGLGIN